METPESLSSAGLNEELRRTCGALQSQVNILLFALILVAGTFSVYLYVQDRWTNRELQVVKGPALQMRQILVKERPVVMDFLAKLRDYSKTHPDFGPIAEKYRGILAPPPPAPNQPGQ